MPGEVAGLQVVSRDNTRIVEGEQAQVVDARPFDTRAEVGRVELQRAEEAAITGQLALEEPAHRIPATDAELLARDQRIFGVLRVQTQTQLPVALERTAVVHAVAQDGVVALGPFAGHS